MAVLLYLGIWLAAPAFGRADEQSDDEGLEEEFALLEDQADVVEAPARHAQDIGMSPSAVTIITRRDIATSGADNLADLLRLVPGMDVITGTPFYSALSGRLYRNGENQQFLVLIDGREANDDLTGNVFIALQPVFLEDIERIEVIRGPGSTLYGANALAGVISITTRAVPEKTSAWAKFSGGEPGACLLGARASTTAGEWGISASGGLDYSGKFIDPRALGREVGKARLLVQRKFGDRARILLDGGYSHGKGYFSSQLGTVDFTVHQIQSRLAFQATPLKGHLYYVGEIIQLDNNKDIEIAGSRLATIGRVDARGHTLDGEIQWDAPKFWNPLLLITGARVRGAWILSDDLLDGEGFASRTSPHYHRRGIDWSEMRAGGFLHAEMKPASWLVLTAGARLDYNTTSGLFASPRIATVFQPWPGHFFRLGAARSFRKPSFQESGFHMAVGFPPDGPIQGADQTEFQEFMSKALGNSDLPSEKLWAFEAGYRVRLFDGRLSASFEAYGNYHTDIIDFETHLATTPQGMIDLQETRLRFASLGHDAWIWGVEIGLRYKPVDEVLLQAAWSHREVPGEVNGTPKNLLLLGGRFETRSGFMGSLYLSTRSEFWSGSVENPEGMLFPPLNQHLPNSAVLLGRLGYRWSAWEEAELEVGIRLYLPVSLDDFSFSYRGRGGGTTPGGYHYGGEELGRRVGLYLEGSL